MTDHSDDIAYLRVVLETLQDLEPGGTWSDHNLLKKWQANHYSLTVREFKRLSSDLVEHLESTQKQLLASRYQQMSFFE